MPAIGRRQHARPAALRGAVPAGRRLGLPERLALRLGHPGARGRPSTTPPSGFTTCCRREGYLNLRVGRLLLLDFLRPEHRFLTGYGQPHRHHRRRAQPDGARFHPARRRGVRPAAGAPAVLPPGAGAGGAGARRGARPRRVQGSLRRAAGDRAPAADAGRLRVHRGARRSPTRAGAPGGALHRPLSHAGRPGRAGHSPRSTCSARRSTSTTTTRSATASTPTTGASGWRRRRRWARASSWSRATISSARTTSTSQHVQARDHAPRGYLLLTNLRLAAESAVPARCRRGQHAARCGLDVAL